MTADPSRLSSRPRPGDDLASRDIDREMLLFQAQLCEQSNRFDDMVNIMNEICRIYYRDLAEEERNLLSCAYKNVIGSRRTSWRVIKENLEYPQSDSDNKISMAIPSSNNSNQSTTINGKSTQESSKYNPIVIQSFLKKIETELRIHCGNIIEILTNRLIPDGRSIGESRVFYYKMKGDYMRYLCEISTASERKEKANESLLAYKAACDKAMIELPPTHPVRLGLMLNFSVFYYDIMKSPERSCRLAKQAFDDAIAELDTLSEESYRDSTIIMQLLRDNLNLWESEQIVQANSNTDLFQG